MASIDDVEDISPRVQYTASAAQTDFDFPFPIFENEDIVVNVDGVDLALDTQYAVTGAGDDNGGSVSLVDALAGGEVVTIYRDIPIERITDFQQNGPWTASAVNDELDRITLIEQQLEQGIQRSLRLPITADIADSEMELDPATWANKYITLDATGKPTPAELVAGTVTKSTITSLLGGNPNRDQTAQELAEGVTPTHVEYDPEYIERQGAVADYPTTNNLTAINKAISVNTRRIKSFDGDFKVSLAPTNPNGIEFEGTGNILLPTAFTFPQQLNTYADMHKYAIGREYLYRVDLRLSVSNFGATNLGVFLYGDSTIEGAAIVSSANLLQNLLPQIANKKGLSCGLNVTNRGVSGTKVSDMSALGDLSTTTDFYIIKYGINDGLNSATTRLDTFSSTLRSKLAAIRAATNGDLQHLAILLVGPNATASDTDGRNEQWYEQLRGIYVQAARDYQCAYFDTYAFLKDSRAGAGLWMDTNTVGGQSNVPIHPVDIAQQWIWGAIMDFVFPHTAMTPYRGNHVQNMPSLVKKYTLANVPDDFDFGITMSRALTADSWPVDGMVITNKQVNGPTLQTLVPTTPGVQVYQRQGNTSSWSIWYGEDTVTPAMQNSWVAFTTGTDIKAIKGGKIVTVNGLIKSGTVTDGTLLATLPVGFRPRATYWFSSPASGGTSAQISVGSDGTITGQKGLNATFTAVSCSFEAVN